MTKPFARQSVRALFGAGALSLLLLGCNIGCASHSADLRLTCLESSTTYRQQFSDAYVSKGEEGNTEILLVSDHNLADSGGVRPAGAALQPAAVRQVMHLKILWRPQRGTKQGHPSYTNAGIKWYVSGEPAAGGAATDVLEYTGAGFVSLTDTPVGTQVTIRNASLKPVGAAKGQLNDPVGPSRLAGSFVAEQNAQRVSDLLAEVKSAVDGTSTQQASAR